jgi:DNA-binding transcriptional MerR regulator
MHDPLSKSYYKIGEVSELTNIPITTLRFWEKQFTIIKPHRNEAGTRSYTPSDIEVIRMIYFLVKEKGLKLDAAQAELKRNRTGVTRRYEAIARLRKIRAELTTILAAFDEKR